MEFEEKASKRQEVDIDGASKIGEGNGGARVPREAKGPAQPTHACITEHELTHAPNPGLGAHQVFEGEANQPRTDVLSGRRAPAMAPFVRAERNGACTHMLASACMFARARVRLGGKAG